MQDSIKPQQIYIYSYSRHFLSKATYNWEQYKQ